MSASTITLTALARTGTPRGVSFGWFYGGDGTSGLIVGTHDSRNIKPYYRYAVSGNTVTTTTLTRAGATPHYDLEHATLIGDGTSGVFFGGYNYSSRVPVLGAALYGYSVVGNTVTLRQIRTSALTVGRVYPVWAGSKTTGILYGGRGGEFTDDWDDNFYRYNFTATTASATQLTRAGSTFTASKNARPRLFGDAISGLILTYGGDFFSYSVAGNTITITALTKTGTTFTLNSSFNMVGNKDGGLIFGDSTSSANIYSFSRGGTVAPPPVSLRTLCLTQTAYDALAVKDPGTIYLITA